ncbi:TPA: helix-turn-helix transcriptional regulator [Salmonella enterica]|nr:helix-turn-helix transcriptional regulator [Salmonella enterica]HEA0369846.1 helix-turn-helix transcriptional regulator [Salmonella enterica]HEA2144705.1 helix-turn-helix transcriptional regulator [Salmonella enterica]HEA2153466.1 helix-turn-helix transcriptional regulator [Salmonella enterica]
MWSDDVLCGHYYIQLNISQGNLLMSYSFGSKLREERERLALNQTEFAEACGVKQLAQSNYENDKRKPDATYLIAAANLGVDMNYLFTGVRVTSPYGTANTRDEAEMLEEYRAGTEAARDSARYTLTRSAMGERKRK